MSWCVCVLVFLAMVFITKDGEGTPQPPDSVNTSCVTRPDKVDFDGGSQ